MTKPKPSRKRWRIVLAMAVLFSAVGWLVAFPAYKRHRAVQEIERVSGWVESETVGPQWLQKLGFGFDRVWMVYLVGTEITDDGLQHLSSLTNLKCLSLSGTHVSDDGLKHLSGLTNLEYLFLVNTQVTDDGVKMLQESLPECNIHR
jgi:hypothetical protein